MKQIFLLFIIALTCFSCGNSPEISIDKKIEGDWSYFEPLSYNFDVSDPSSYYDLILAIRYDADFSYQNIYVKIVTTYPNKEKTEDILSLNISDGFGSFLGKCNSGTCTTDIALQNKFKFKESGNYTIEIFQNGREDNLEGVQGALLELYKIQQ